MGHLNQYDMEDHDIIKTASELRWKIGDQFHDKLTESIYADASDIASNVEILKGNERNFKFDAALDRILTSKIYGFPIMILILSVILWLTIEGANYPSGLLGTLFLEIIYPFLK